MKFPFQVSAPTAAVALFAALAWSATSEVYAKEVPVAVFRDDKEVEVVDPHKKYDDKDWLSLEFSEYAGLKPRIFIHVSEGGGLQGQLGLTGTAPSYTWVMPQPTANDMTGGVVPVARIADLLASSLMDSHRFDIVEREQLGRILAEQGLGGSGLLANPSAPKVGALLGAQYAVMVTVDEWIPEVEKSHTRMGTLRQRWGGGVDLGKAKSMVVLTVKVVDIATGKFIASETVAGTASSRSIGLGGIRASTGGWLGGTHESTKKAPITEALAVAVHKATYRIVTELRERPWQSVVAKVNKDGAIYIRGGTAVGLQEGQEFDVYARGEDLEDPETGESLGAALKLIGRVRTDAVGELSSVVQVVSGCKGIKRGDVLITSSSMAARVED